MLLLDFLHFYTTVYGLTRGKNTGTGYTPQSFPGYDPGTPASCVKVDELLSNLEP